MNSVRQALSLGVVWSWLAAITALADGGDAFRAPKIAMTADGQTAWVLQAAPGRLMRLSSMALDQGAGELESVGNTTSLPIIDAALIDNENEVLLACDQPPSLVRQSLMPAGEPKSISLPAKPARLVLSQQLNDKQFICVSLPALRSVWLGSVGPGHEIEGNRMQLSFAPRELLALEHNRFVVADAAGSRIAIVDAELRKVTIERSFSGVHLSGLAMDSLSGNVLLTHQLFSSNARTDRDDIRWGNLVQNNIASIPLKSLLKSETRLSSDTNYRLGEFGHGSADPAGVVALGDRIAVALSGTDEVGFYSKPQHQARYVAVGHVPDRLYPLGSKRLLCVHRLDARIAVINCEGDAPRLERMIGTERPMATAVQRGELAFYSGHLSHEGWMSCNSCHIEGSTSDQLIDTMGDGTFDSPKKTPSLENVASTGPWAWHGGRPTLHAQITKTLASTMHTPDELPASTGLSRETLIDDLVAYLSTLKATDPPLDTNSDPNVSTGEALFQQHCAKCHDPEQHFTTPRSYDIGINDERGQKLFNPPSLIGVSKRVRYMHDGRYTSLSKVILSHPQPAANLTSEERELLRQYLERL